MHIIQTYIYIHFINLYDLNYYIIYICYMTLNMYEKSLNFVGLQVSKTPSSSNTHGPRWLVHVDCLVDCGLWGCLEVDVSHPPCHSKPAVFRSKKDMPRRNFRDPIDFHMDVRGCVYPIIHNVICKYMYKCKNYIDIHMNTEKIHMFVWHTCV